MRHMLKTYGVSLIHSHSRYWHYFHTGYTSRPLRPSTFQNLAKKQFVRIGIAAARIMGLAEWIIDDTCFVQYGQSTEYRLLMCHRLLIYVVSFCFEFISVLVRTILLLYADPLWNIIAETVLVTVHNRSSIPHEYECIITLLICDML